jgi:hypothetical protein
VLIVILICSLATATADCSEQTALSVVVLPERPPMCGGLDAQAYAAQIGALIEEGKEYAKVVCRMRT